MSHFRRFALFVFLTLGLVSGVGTHAEDAQFGFDSSLNVYTESPYS